MSNLIELKKCSNVQHNEQLLTSANALTKIKGADVQIDNSNTLVFWALEYLNKRVFGIQAKNTCVAKQNDLQKFFEWFWDMNGTLNIADWLPRDTQAFMDALEKEGKAPATVNRYLATLRHFSRWVCDRGDSPFEAGNPCAGIRELEIVEPPAKKITQRELTRLFKAADKLVAVKARKNARPSRDRAILAIAYHTGLRASEICALQIDQYITPHFVNVRRKGISRTPQVYVSTKAREMLDHYIKEERGPDAEKMGDNTLFLSAMGKPLDRQHLWRVFKRIADEASAHHEERLKIHPHRLRHTFGFELRKRTQSDTETAAMLGHKSTKYVGRYVRQTDEERKKVLDDL